MSQINFKPSDLDYLLSTVAVRERSKILFDQALNGKTHFKLNLERLDECANFVFEVIKQNYPSFEIPFHSRLGHFKALGVDRVLKFNQLTQKLSTSDRLQALLDLVIVSVLLDAGAGMQWSYFEASTNLKLSKSEGLAIASFDMFCAGKFSDQGENPFQVTGQALINLTLDDLKQGFQVSEVNPLLGLEGRLNLLKSCGELILAKPNTFGSSRLSSFLNQFTDQDQIDALKVLNAVLTELAPIWPGRLSLAGQSLGDAWQHRLLGNFESSSSIIPFHKLSQWLTYSLLDSFINFNKKVINTEHLTGLPEYRNGGLFLDCQVLELRDQSSKDREHQASDELIIEWRALTVILLDLLAEKIRSKLNKSEVDFPLAKVLEGGSWAAGRVMAKKLRADGGPPLNIISDGTVF
jgi:hypothetical protein